MPQNITGTEGFSGGAYQKPSPKDRGVTDVFAVLETFMERMANHQHTGADSKEISLNFQKEVQDLVEGVDYTWDDQGSKNLRMPVAIPGIATESNMRKYFFKTTTITDWSEFYPNTTRIDASNFYLYSNDDDITNVRVVYF